MNLIREISHDVTHVIIMSIAYWLHRERKILRDVISRKLERRHTMIPLTVLAEIPQALTLVTTVVPKIEAAVPLISKTIADVNQAIKDGKNPTALQADLVTALTDIQNDLSTFAAFFPATAS